MQANRATQDEKQVLLPFSKSIASLPPFLRSWGGRGPQGKVWKMGKLLKEAGRKGQDGSDMQGREEETRARWLSAPPQVFVVDRRRRCWRLAWMQEARRIESRFVEERSQASHRCLSSQPLAAAAVQLVNRLELRMEAPGIKERSRCSSTPRISAATAHLSRGE